MALGVALLLAWLLPFRAYTTRHFRHEGSRDPAEAERAGAHERGR